MGSLRRRAHASKPGFHARARAWESMEETRVEDQMRSRLSMMPKGIRQSAAEIFPSSQSAPSAPIRRLGSDLHLQRRRAAAANARPSRRAKEPSTPSRGKCWSSTTPRPTILPRSLGAVGRPMHRRLCALLTSRELASAARAQRLCRGALRNSELHRRRQLGRQELDKQGQRDHVR